MLGGIDMSGHLPGSSPMSRNGHTEDVDLFMILINLFQDYLYKKKTEVDTCSLSLEFSG